MAHARTTPSGYGLGWQPQTPDPSDYKFAADPQIIASLPSTVDLRPVMPPKPIQNQTGSCTGNGGSYIFDAMRIHQGLAPIIGSRNFLYWNERSLEGTTGQDAGATIRDQMKALAQWGICPETEWPYDAGNMLTQPPQQDYTDALAEMLLQYAAVDQSTQQIMGTLAGGLAFSFGFMVYQGYEQMPQSGIMPMPQMGERPLGGHNNVAVGYDATRARYPDTLVLCANWWNDPANGHPWGPANMDGYCWIPMAFLTNAQYSADLWVPQLVSAPLPPPPPPPPAGGVKITMQPSQSWALLSADGGGLPVTWNVSDPSDFLELDPGDSGTAWIAAKRNGPGRATVTASVSGGKSGSRVIQIDRYGRIG